LTVVRVPGNTHDPLNHADERNSLSTWLNWLVPFSPSNGSTTFNYENALPAIQGLLE
jgi:hypothetical protein